MMQSITDAEQSLLMSIIRHARQPISVYSSLVGKSRNWVSKTIRGFVKYGVIHSYLTVIDSSRISSERGSLLFIKSNPREHQVSFDLLEMPGLESLDGITGDYSLLASFRNFPSINFETFLDQIDRTIAKTNEGKYKMVQVLSTYKAQEHPMKAVQSDDKPLSKRDFELLSLISKRRPSEEQPFPLSQEQIGKMMNPPMTQSAVSKAMQRLEMRGAIVGYSAVVDYSLIGLSLKFFLQIRVRPGTISETAQSLIKKDEVWDLHRTSEDFSLFATVRTSDVDSYNHFLRGLYDDENILDTQTHLSMETWSLDRIL
jgi:DNA-binding Lrp family transcriptional regulator